jgi:hypothetical protein
MIIHTVILPFLLFHCCRTKLYDSHLGFSILEISLKPSTVSCYSFQAACLNIISVLGNFANSFRPWCEDALQSLLTSCFTKNVSRVRENYFRRLLGIVCHLLVRQYRCVLFIICSIRIDSHQFIIHSEMLQKKCWKL